MWNSWDAKCKLLINFKNFEAYSKTFSEETSYDVLVNTDPETAYSFLVLHFKSGSCDFWTLL